MPILFNIAANLLLGSALPLRLPHSPALKTVFLSWQLLFLLAFEAVLVTPVAATLCHFYPAWSLLYSLDPQLYPTVYNAVGLACTLAVICNFAALILGFACTRWAILHKRHKLQQATTRVALAAWLLLWVLCSQQTLHVGEFDNYLQGQANLLWQSGAGWLSLLLYGAGIAFVQWTSKRYQHTEPNLLEIT